jgi:Na+/H+ antiporter NhaD/arsenite permease-like protein
MIWIVLFILSIVGIVYYFKSYEMRLEKFLATYPEGLKDDSDAETHKIFEKQTFRKMIPLWVLLLLSCVCLVGISIQSSFMGLFATAIFGAVTNQYFKKVGQTGKQFDQLHKDYQTAKISMSAESQTKSDLTVL